MRKLLFLFPFGLLFLLNACQQSPAVTNPDSNTNVSDRRVDSVLATMDIADKVGEMTQLTLDMIAVGEPNRIPKPLKLDTAKLRDVLVNRRIGSILNIAGHPLTRTEWAGIISTIQDIAMTEKKSGIPVLYGIDAIHGTNYTTDAVLFPQQIGLAATWNPAFAHTTGEVAAYESRASHIPWAFAPVCDIGRDPRWPRFWETFGEDVHLAKTMAVAMTEGFQGDDISDPYHAAACMKHFLGYSMPWSGKDRTPAYIPERQLQEYFVPPFQAAVDAGAATIMICSGEMNGIPVHSNPKILKDLLRDQMGFEGLAVSDWADIVYLYTRHRVANDHKEAIMMAINAGIDMSMVPYDVEFTTLLTELVEEGKVPMSRIDEAVRRILKLKFDLGLFAQPTMKDVDYANFGGEEHQAKAMEAASESIILLKNENNTLPLKPKSKIFVTGPTADNLRSLNGGWTGNWQGDNPDYNTKTAKTVLGALQEAFNVSYEPGCSFDEEVNIKKAARVAKRADAIILCLGELSYTESPGSISDMNLPDAQYALARAMYATGKPVILLMLEGRPRIIGQIAKGADAILLAPLPGDFGSQAIAGILDGRINPSGKLPYTYPQRANSLLTYDHKTTEMIQGGYWDPLFEFGHGLSYSTFEYSDFSLSNSALTANGSIEVKVTVTNTSQRAGKEVVQVYVTDSVASVTPSVRRLRGYAKTKALKPGESERFSFTIKSEDLAFVGRDLAWVTEPGVFGLTLGKFSQSFTYQAE